MGLMKLQAGMSSSWQKGHSWFAQQLNDTKPGGTIASLDGVRALAFLLVFNFHLYHTGVWEYHGSASVSSFLLVGSTGVTLFFVLSGFLLFLPYTQALLFEKDWPQPKIYLNGCPIFSARHFNASPPLQRRPATAGPP